MNSFLQFFTYLIVSMGLFFLIERLIRKKWNICSPYKNGLQGVNSIHIWGKRTLWAVFFLNTVIVRSVWINFSIIMVLCLFDIFMEWKFNTERKEYMISIVGLVFFIAFVSVGYTFDWLL
ncbi:DUF4181 domain-containing protein [Bacillus sp. KH172YL63]|uniref:DUF4181 domain-containing protein n=1 Tax=Bacillus sp. KH172YL63 TaxID=2709784 RepID=UPI0013E4C982|nr:DUF4181 domain-containing protein [Bacillus sp. KH172YL63]BCB03970.1 hypothetical protein KH172YL63_21030 [Bacillus sp. KH172YL63]